MTPSHIRLFDGLRVTTEHLDHLQAAFLTAVSDLRLLHTDFPVIAGFDVSISDGIVTVEPGLAFDFEGQRIFCDKPQTFDLNEQNTDSDTFVLAEYRQMESGEVEGKFTLVWDSCHIFLSDGDIGNEQDIVVLAKLERGDDGITIQSSEAYYEEQRALSASSPSIDDAIADLDDDESDLESEASTDATPAVASAENDIVDEGPPADGDEELGSDSADVVDQDSTTEAVVAESGYSTRSEPLIRVSQGFEQIGAESDVDLVALLLADLSAAADAGTDAPSWLLDEREIELDYLPASLTLQTESTATINLSPRATSAAEPADDVGNEPSSAGLPVVEDNDALTTASHSFQSNSVADACREHDGFKQTSTSHVSGSEHMRAYLRDGQINHLPLLNVFEAANVPPLSLYIRLVVANERPVIEVRLAADVVETDALIEWLERTSVQFSWTADIAWKAANIQSLP